VALTTVSNKFLLLERLILPILEQDGHLDVSGYDLKNIFNCKIEYLLWL